MLICKYIKLLLKKWYVYLSLIPVVQGFSVSYLKTEIYLQQSVLWIFALVTIFIACYSVWLDQKKENSRLKETIKEYENKFSNFKLTAVLKKIYVEDGYSSKLMQRKRKEINDKLGKLEVEINSISTIENKFPIRSINLPKFYGIHSDPDDVRLNKEQLIKYKNALNDYLDNTNNYQKEIQCLINERIKNCYLVSFFIENTSKKYDEDIDLSINIGDENSFLDNEYLSNFLSKYLNVPKRKSFNNDGEGSISFSDDIFSNANNINKLLSNQDINAFYKYFELSKHSFSLNIKGLKANETVQITRKAFVVKLNNINSLQYNILSKLSGKKITGSVVLDMDENSIEYEGVVMSEGINYLECED